MHALHLPLDASTHPLSPKPATQQPLCPPIKGQPMPSVLLTLHQAARSCLPLLLTPSPFFHLASRKRGMKRLTSTVALLLLLFLTSASLQDASVGSAFCNSKCAARCSKASVRDRCLQYCGICCEECKCVPSGTYGNKDECPCYRDKLTSDRKKHKCP